MEGNDAVSNLNSGKTSSEVVRWDTENGVLIKSTECGHSQCLKGSALSETLINALSWWCGLTFILCLIILLIYFVDYRYKKHPNPLKHALKKTGIRGILIFILIPIVLFIVIFISLLFDKYFVGYGV